MSSETTTAEYWQNRWKEGDSTWHRDKVNTRLKKFANELTRGRPNLRVFVPLCGKSLDMVWLADQGHTIVGVDVAKQAIESFFAENSLTYKLEFANMGETAEPKEVYKCSEKAITIFCCDLFSLAEKDVGGKFDAIWDRGSLSAMAPSLGDRGRLYAEKMYSLLAYDGRYMLESHRYDVDRQGKPPANIPEELLNEMYGKRFIIKEIDVHKQEAVSSKNLSAAIALHYHMFTPKAN